MGRIQICDRCQVEFGENEPAGVMGTGPGMNEIAHADRAICDAYLKLKEKGIKTVIGRGSLGRDPRIVGEATALEGHHLEVWVDGEKLVGQGVTVLSTKGEAPKGPDLAAAEAKLLTAEEIIQAEITRIIQTGEGAGGINPIISRHIHDGLDVAMGRVRRARNDLKWPK